jgi:hypothetical protein
MYSDVLINDMHMPQWKQRTLFLLLSETNEIRTGLPLKDEIRFSSGQKY